MISSICKLLVKKLRKFTDDVTNSVTSRVHFRRLKKKRTNGPKIPLHSWLQDLECCSNTAKKAKEKEDTN